MISLDLHTMPFKSSRVIPDVAKFRPAAGLAVTLAFHVES